MRSGWQHSVGPAYRRGSRDGGFTLVEVMIALAIMATALVVLISVSAADLREVQRAQLLNVATSLARGKVYDIEEELLREGFQQTTQELDGDFSEEGWEKIRWTAEVHLIELPNLTNISGEQLDDGDSGGAGADENQSPLAGMLSSFGLGGKLAGNEAAGAGLISSQFGMIQEVLKQSIRKIVVRVEWTSFGDECDKGLRERMRECFAQKTGCDDRELQEQSLRCEEIVVDYYVTEPAAIKRVISGVPDSSGDDSSDSSDSSGSTDSSDSSGRGRSLSTGGRAVQ